jgi:nucleoside-diphosphate-sugar epimerase
MTTLIVGCGYLGRRVAMRLVERGERVIGTTRDPAKAEDLERIGVEPLILDLLRSTPHPDPPPQGGRGQGGVRPDTSEPSRLAGEGRVGGDQRTIAGPVLPEFDRLVYCVGLDRTSGAPMKSVYLDGLTNLLGFLQVRSFRFVYTSSTSVYGQDHGAWVTEDDPTEPTSESGRVVLEAEGIARYRGAVVLRLAGLYGAGRIIRRAAILAGEPIAGDPRKRVNLVHVEDAASAVVAALDRGRPGRVYNVADDRPADREELYGLSARCLGAPPPKFVPAAAYETDRRIANRRMKEELGVSLIHPDITAGLPASVEAEAERVSPRSPR